MPFMWTEKEGDTPVMLPDSLARKTRNQSENDLMALRITERQKMLSQCETTEERLRALEIRVTLLEKV